MWKLVDTNFGFSNRKFLKIEVFPPTFPFDTAAAERTLMFDPKIPETPENLGTGNSSESP